MTQLEILRISVNREMATHHTIRAASHLIALAQELPIGQLQLCLGDFLTTSRCSIGHKIFGLSGWGAVEDGEGSSPRSGR